MLVLSELITAVFLVVAALYTFERLSEERSYMHSYLLKPLVWIGNAMAADADLAAVVGSNAPDEPARAQQALGSIQAFVNQYRDAWQVVGATDPAAVRLRGTLDRINQTALLEEEREALAALEAALQGASGAPRYNVGKIGSALVGLNRVNLQYMEAAYDAYSARWASLTTIFLMVGGLGILLAPLFGLAVRRAIVPRVERLVQKIQRFRELGVSEPINDRGGDELAVLAHTLDVGFAAISARDEERKRFLGIAAHELKTPLTTMKGFARAALDHRDDPAVCDRALAIIDRQATRLARLVQDLLWVARVQAGNLPFRPGPVDLAALTRRMIDEVALVVRGREFPVTERGDAHLLGDPALLEHALFSLLIQAATMAPAGEPVHVAIEGGANHVRIAVDSPADVPPPDDLEQMVEPFAVLQYEDLGETRSTGLGLYLAREIARLHGASLEIEQRAGGGVVFALELPR